MGLIQLMPAVWFLLEPGLLFGRVIVPETGRLCFGDKFYITDKDERLKYGPREKGEVLQPDWGSRTPRNVPFIQQTFPEPTHSGWWVVGGWVPRETQLHILVNILVKLPFTSCKFFYLQ